MGKVCFFFCVHVLFVHCLMFSLVVTETNFTTDQSALLTLKAYINSDPHNILAYNWSTSSSLCSWVGVTCGSRHLRVTAINLPNMGLNGTIPPHLGNLSFLVSLDISGNNFHGHLPRELGRLRRLKLIDFNYNYFSGGFPSWFGIFSELKYLGLYNNSFTGTILPSLFNMSKLEGLELSYNFIQGNIPVEIGNCPNMNILSLSHNQLSGSIPSVIYNISSLRIFDFSSNSLSGILPDDMCNGLPKLELLYLYSNELYGQLPSSLGKCNKLQNLALSYNKFTGEIPRCIGNFTNLEELYLGDNILKGPIPPAIFNISSLEKIALANNTLSGGLPLDLCHYLPRLEFLYLHNNKLTGSIPKDIGNCTLLKTLRFNRNQLTGILPNEIGDLHRLEFLDIGSNNLTGLIPSTIFNISTIEVIGLQVNHLTGSLPSSIGVWVPNLKELYLGTNNLSGTISNSISNASKLTVLDLSYNSFSGLIPNGLGNLRLLQLLHFAYNHLTTESSTQGQSFLSSLTNCRYLRMLVLTSTSLNGASLTSIGNFSTSLEGFYAVNCNIKGSIPMEIGNLSNVLVLNLANNELIGAIPPTVGRLEKLQGVFFYGNKLQGSIPYDLCHLEGLFDLYLNNNYLSGHIPTCFGNLTYLRYLNLGSNKLRSPVPSTFWSLTYILEVDLSSNSFSGSLLLDLQNLKVLTWLDLSGNQLSGDIPSTIGSLKDLVTLLLADNKLGGPIPESFGGLISLEFLDLSINNLTGVIPKSLEEILNLEYFNVSFNMLEGEIPIGGPFKNFSAQSFMRNYALCGSPRLQVLPCKSSILNKSKTIHVLKYILSGIMSIILVVAIIIAFIRCRKREAPLPTQENVVPLATWRRVSYHDLLHAANGFSESNLLGTGSFGSVYNGTLSDGMIVAIKVFNLQLERAFRSFGAECEVMNNIRHRNLLKIITSCCNIDFKALVLEFMPNGSLDKWLYSHNYFLDIVQRMNIMIDVASALEYLHHGYSVPVVHCDLKPRNVLLDEDMVAHVGDFGIAKLLGEGDSMTQTMTLATIGYMAPEYGSEGIVSVKGDVYSYGILLMETFTRKKPTDEMFVEVSLKCWVNQSLPHAITQVVDVNLLGREEEHFAAKKDCMLSIMELALECSVELPEHRINMIDVLSTLKKIKNKFLKDVEHFRRRNL